MLGLQGIGYELHSKFHKFYVQKSVYWKISTFRHVHRETNMARFVKRVSMPLYSCFLVCFYLYSFVIVYGAILVVAVVYIRMITVYKSAHMYEHLRIYVVCTGGEIFSNE